ncbi:hypothetical protein Tco_0588923 [Tanacetum coccineum]
MIENNLNLDFLRIKTFPPNFVSKEYDWCEYAVHAWRKTSEAKEYRSKNIHFEECGCLGLEDDEDVTEVEDGEETTKEDDVNPSFLDKSEAGITHSMTLLDVNDKAEAPFDEPEAPQHNEPEPNEPETPPFDEPEHNTPSDEAKAPDDASNDSDEANDEPRPNPQDGA